MTETSPASSTSSPSTTATSTPPTNNNTSTTPGNGKIMDRKRPHRACAACKSRKIKCSGDHPQCQQCSHLNLVCLYPEPTSRQQTKPRTKRGGIITKYKKAANGSALPTLRLRDGGGGGDDDDEDDDLHHNPPVAEGVLYDKSYFTARLRDYEQNIYPVFPVITPAELAVAIETMNTDRDTAALVYSLFAVTVGHSRTTPRGPHSTASSESSTLIDMALEARGVLKPKRQITVASVITGVAVSSALVASNDIEIAWLYLREAATMASILKCHDVAKLKAIESLQERSRRQRLYWLLYIHERFMAIHFYRPVLLKPLAVLPELDPTIPVGIFAGFLQIIKLFRLVDGNFINAYLGEAGETSDEITRKWIEEKQNEIKDSETGIEGLTEMQQADLIVTQQWLRMLVWQMAMSRYWLSTGISEGCMSLLFPVEIAHRLRALMSKCSAHSIEVHGSAILCKLFELAIAIADVIILIPAKNLKESADRIDDYMWIANFLLAQSSFTDVQKALLTEKLEKVSSVLPNTPVSRPDSPDEVQPDDPWLSLSRSFATNGSSPKDLIDLSMDRMPLMANLSNLSEMSQGLLNALNYPLLTEDSET